MSKFSIHRDLIRRRSVTLEDAGRLLDRRLRAGFHVEHLRWRGGQSVGHTWRPLAASSPYRRGAKRAGSGMLQPPFNRRFAMAAYSRGAADMKGSVAAMVALEQFVAASASRGCRPAADQRREGLTNLDGVRKVVGISAPSVNASTGAWSVSRRRSRSWAT